jgi:hypothetical protein
VDQKPTKEDPAEDETLSIPVPKDTNPEKLKRRAASKKREEEEEEEETDDSDDEEI